MRKKALISIAFIILVGAAIALAKIYPGLRPAINPAPAPIDSEIPAYVPPQNDQAPPHEPASLPAYSGPLRVPQGFDIRIYASGFRKPRILALDPNGRIAVSDIDAGIVYVMEERGSVAKTALLSGLDRPHGIEFHDGYVYVAETKSISRYTYDAVKVKAGAREKLLDLPYIGGHFTRTLRFGPDGALYVSVGSSCNVCREEDERLASVMRYEPSTWRGSVFARGLRNTVGFVMNPATNEFWGVDNGRDWLGDNLPPEEVNIIRAGDDYGWPICYGQKIHDSDFDKNQYFRDPCADTSAPVFELPAHNAPLGLVFVTSPKFPDEWQGDLIVTLHGSWNRTIPDGYKIVRVDVQGNRGLASEDFITGFIAGNGAVGRPVDVLFGADGVLYASDDKAGVIYRVAYTGIKN